MKTTSEHIKELEDTIGKINYLIDDFETHHEPWCMTGFKTHRGESRTRFEPITTSRFIEPLLKGKVVIEMSATLPKRDGDLIIDVDSPFPREIRPWRYVPIGRMSKKYRDKNYPKLAMWLASLEGKTLVHCHSYAFASSLAQELRKIGVYPLQQVNSGYEAIEDDIETVNRYDAVKAFIDAKDEDKILLSVKLDRGVDFHQPEIVNNVIAVLGFPNPKDPLTLAKNLLLGESWQVDEVIADVVQKKGRIHRNEKPGIYKGKPKTKTTYIVDSNWSWFFKEHHDKFPKEFLESQMTSQWFSSIC